MICSTCRAENPGDAKFCVACAASLSLQCAECNQANPAHAKFCSNCAAPLKPGPAASESIQAPKGHPAEPQTAVSSADGERRRVTVLFCDLVSSTEIAARLDPEEWHAIAAQYQRTSAAAAITAGGHVAKYLGDGLVVYFGYPEAREDAAERAVRAGLAIVETMQALNARFAAEHKVRLQVRVGIHCGTVVVAKGGDKEADMFGDAPNIASRVQSAADADTVVITADVHQIVSGLFSVEDRGPHLLKGIDQPFRLYRVLSAGLASGRGRGFSARAATPLVGRHAEINSLLGRWSLVRRGSGQLLLATGEPGIGKTRLVEDFKARIKADAHLWVECYGAQFFSNSPFHTVIQMLDQGLALRGDESPEERVARLEQALGGADVNLDEAVPLIAEMLNLPIPPKYPPLRIPHDRRRQHLFHALTAWVLGASRNQPLVIVIEDLHWVDPSTLELLQILVQRGATVPLLLLCTARPEFHAPWPMQSHHTVLVLNRLNFGETRELIAGVIAREGLTPEMVDAVIRRTDGVPLFAEELARLMLESGSGLGERDIPATLQDSLAARLDRLGQAKDIAQLGAVLGREFTYKLLAAIAPMHEVELKAGLTKLADAELIYVRGLPPDASYQFKHALIRDAAYEALLRSKRRELHARIAQTLEASFADVARVNPEMVAHHHTQANNPEQAVRWWRQAGHNSIHATAYAEALDHLNRALGQLALLPESPDRDKLEAKLRIDLSTPLVGIGGYTSEELRKNVDRAVALYDTTKEEALFPALGGQLSLAYGGSYMIRAVAIGEQLFSAAEMIGDRGLRMLASWLLGMALTGRGQLEAALQTLDHGLGISDPTADAKVADIYSSNPRVAILAYRALVLLQLGFPDRAAALAEATVKEAKQGDHSATIGLALTLQISVLLLRCDHAALAVSARELAALAKRQSSQPLQAVAGAVLGLLEAERQPDEKIFVQVHQIIEGIRAAGWNLMVGWLSLLEAKICLGHGRLEAARRTLDALQEVIEPRGHDFFLPELYRLRADLSLREGARDSTAEEYLEHAMALAQKQKARLAELRAATDLARLWRERGQRSDARALLVPLYGWFGEGAETFDLVRARSVLESLD